MDIQRLRNLTTRRLHTQMADIYEDIENLTGIRGLMTHQLPDALEAMLPWLRSVVSDSRFWDGEYDPGHTGEIEVPVCTAAQSHEIWLRLAGC